MSADLDREPGPQSSKASPETWRATDLILYAVMALFAAIALFSVLEVVHIVATNGA